MSISKLCDKYDIGFNQDVKMISLTDVAEKIIKSKSPNIYIGKTKNKVRIDGVHYMSPANMVIKLESCNKKSVEVFLGELKQVMSEVNDEVDDEDDGHDVKELIPIQYERPDGLKEIEGTFLDIKNNYLKYDGKDVIVIVDKNGNAWFKGIDVARLLSFKEPANAISHNVELCDKIEYKSINMGFNPMLVHKKGSIKSDVIFVSIEGVYDLIGNSRKKEAKIFRRWLSHEILPSINKFGSYSIEKKYGCFYAENDLYKYTDQNLCYIAYIGVHDNEPLFTPLKI
jgi:prophage antirepressor-like protein